MLRPEAGPKILMIVVCIILLVVLMELDNYLGPISVRAEESGGYDSFSFFLDLILETFRLLWEILKFFVSILENIFDTLFGNPYFPEDRELYKLYKWAERVSGLPWQVFWGLHVEESSIGKNLGSYPVMKVLSEDQKVYFLEICQQLNWDPYEIYGSKSGALGPFQIMPETWIRYGVDGNGDGRKDPFTPEDAILTAANYLLNKGGQENLEKALWHYNPDSDYVQRVLSYIRKN
jgi:hypothetical protein